MIFEKALILGITGVGSAMGVMIMAARNKELWENDDLVVALMMLATFTVPAILIYLFPWLNPGF